jgi:hypothetical protein
LKRSFALPKNGREALTQKLRAFLDQEETKKQLLANFCCFRGDHPGPVHTQYYIASTMLFGAGRIEWHSRR